MRERILVRTFDPPSTRMFIGVPGFPPLGSCPICMGPANLVRVNNAGSAITSHQAIDCTMCDYFSGKLSIIKAERR